jgi:mRNA interferase YafQ
MLNIVLSNRFKKDLKTISKRNYNLDLLDEVVSTLAEQKPLPEKNKDHPLTGDYSGFVNAIFSLTGCWYIELKTTT